jgi:serine/threonine protein kinase
MNRDRVYKRTCTSLRIHAFRQNGYLAARDFGTLNLPTTPEILEEVLGQLQTDDLVKVVTNQAGERIYDFLALLEQSVQESVLDVDTRFQLAAIYLHRKLWTHAISELRFTRTHPKYKKESLYLLGTCFEQKGASEKAKENYERLLAIDYYYRDALERLSRLVQQREQQTVISPEDTVVTAQQHLNQVVQDRYEIVRELGRGGAGVVYQAIDLKLKRDVALKVLYQRSAADARRTALFLQEARVTAQLDHPNLVDVYDVDMDAQFIAMEFVNGGTLRDVLKKYHTLPPMQARGVIVQLCRGLQVAHDAGVLHRDIKPKNIFITKRQRIKLGDFGIAHIAQSEQDAFTQIAAQIGTLPYMSPEQVRGETPGVPSDVYAIGVVLYEMLTGAPPFIRGDIAYHHVYSTPTAPRVSPELDALVLRCLAKQPADRFQSVKDLCHALRQQEKAEKTRLAKYRDLLKIALLDKDLSTSELAVLKLKRQALNISDQEARRVEQELGLDLPT